MRFKESIILSGIIKPGEQKIKILRSSRLYVDSIESTIELQRNTQYT